MKFGASNLMGGTQQAMTTAYKTLTALFASNVTSLRRLAVHEFDFSTDGTPADNVMTYDVSDMTVDGTATTITPKKGDAADGAILGVVKGNYTVEPTVTANSSGWDSGVNQRATVRWICAPGDELIIPATNAAGLVFRAKSPGYTGTAIARVRASEL